MLFKKKKVLILTDDMPWGHRSIARAIFGFLKENQSKFRVEIAEIKAETAFMTDMYVFAYKYFPKTNRVMHKISGSRLGKDVLREISILNLRNLKNRIEKINPDLIISTYFLHSHSLAYWRSKENKKFKLWEVVPDPWTINPMSFVKEADLNIVYDENSVKEGIKWGLKREQTMMTGWWTRGEMYEKFDRKKTREKLGFTDDRPVIFVGGGSLGTNSLSKLLPMLLMTKQKLGLVLNTGVDRLSFNLVDQFNRMIKKMKKNDLVLIKHFGWIDNLAEILSACDMVFGKAGPNFLFDCVAARKPFVAMTHIGGQEDGNIELILKKKLGWVKEKNVDLANFLFSYIKNPRVYEKKFLGNIMKERDLNKKSLPMILEKIEDEFKK
ncbi:MAG: glycosyltransferase [Candidatus Shapirobacteria bacterium]|nr:glycosyltransferase [Candidatus Shapirobacteria bacterium]